MRSPVLARSFDRAFFINKKQQGEKVGDDNDDKFNPASPRAIYGTIFTIASAIGGGIYYQQSNPHARPDPFTGTQGALLTQDIEAAQVEILKLQDYVNHFSERGPADVRESQKEMTRLLEEIRERVIEIKLRVEDIRAKQKDFERQLVEAERAQRDHFRDTKNHGP